MITVICTNTNEKITLTKEITHSGEAKIWQTSRSGYLAKIYHNPTEQRSKKLEVMIAHPPQEPNQHLGHISFAWPESILKDEQGKNIGFLMPQVEGGKELPKIYNPSLRKKQNLKVDWQFLYVMARNIAALIGELHRAGYVIGDMKPQNILVNERARASIIDTDSFQVKNPSTGEIYHCLVGTEGYTPPELIEKEIADIEQTEIHDRYRLGIIIYEIIFSGNKVFQGKWEGEGEQPQISELIRQGIWIYQPNSQMKRVGRTITLDIINSELKECFLRCFNEGNKNPKLRPRAIEWLSALEIGMNQLLECEKIEGHYYNSSYGSCYWCERARDLGVDIFPGIERVKPIISKKPEEKYNQEEYDPVIIADHNSGKATNITKIPTVGNINKIINIINKPRRGFLKTAGIAVGGLVLVLMTQQIFGNQEARQIDYTELETLLKAQDFRAADEETERVMLAVANRESEGWLRTEDAEKFPCKELRSIDKLWLKYSGGKFGISVQQQIYQSLGGTKEYNRDVWRSMGDRVGWRQGGEWLSYSDLNFSQTAPSGHLPRALGGLPWASEWRRLFLLPTVTSLLSRHAECNT
jgi:serine/threonine protein kinase